MRLADEGDLELADEGELEMSEKGERVGGEGDLKLGGTRLEVVELTMSNSTSSPSGIITDTSSHIRSHSAGSGSGEGSGSKMNNGFGLSSWTDNWAGSHTW